MLIHFGNGMGACSYFCCIFGLHIFVFGFKNGFNNSSDNMNSEVVLKNYYNCPESISIAQNSFELQNIF